MNQCDGCKLGLPINEYGIHIHPEETGWERLHMCCTKEKYKETILNGNVDQGAVAQSGRALG